MPIKISENGQHRGLPEPMEPVTVVAGNLHSDAVTEIISNRPGFLVRWGITIFFVILLLLLFTCWFVQYPDLIMAEAKLTSSNIPKEVVSKIDGKLMKLYMREGQPVKAGDVIGLVESTANHEEVIALSQKLDTSIQYLYLNRIEDCAHLLNQHYEHLGEVQPSYQEFTKALQKFNDYLVNNYYSHKRSMLANDLKVLQQVAVTIQQHRDLVHKDTGLALETFKMNKILLDEKIISKEEFRVEQSKLLNKLQAIPQLKAEELSNINQQAEKQKELNELDHDMAEQRETFQQAIQTLKSEVDDWKKRYLFVASINGNVSFASFVQENQRLKPGDPVCYITPAGSSYYAEMLIPQANFGKLRIGSAVQLKFSSYPFEEFGSVNGHISFISRIPTDSGYLAKVTLSNGLVTTHKKQIQYRDGLKAEAQVITLPMRLLERFYYSVVKAVDR